jgi:salicylate hydroxylase
VSDPNSAVEHFPPPTAVAVQDVTLEEVLSAYEGYGPEVTTLLSCARNPTKWNINVVYPHIPPEKWVKDRVAILGDAVGALCAIGYHTIQ